MATTIAALLNDEASIDNDRSADHSIDTTVPRHELDPPPSQVVQPLDQTVDSVSPLPLSSLSLVDPTARSCGTIDVAAAQYDHVDKSLSNNSEVLTRAVIDASLNAISCNNSTVERSDTLVEGNSSVDAENGRNLPSSLRDMSMPVDVSECNSCHHANGSNNSTAALDTSENYDASREEGICLEEDKNAASSLDTIPNVIENASEATTSSPSLALFSAAHHPQSPMLVQVPLDVALDGNDAGERSGIADAGLACSSSAESSDSSAQCSNLDSATPIHPIPPTPIHPIPPITSTTYQMDSPSSAGNVNANQRSTPDRLDRQHIPTHISQPSVLSIPESLRSLENSILVKTSSTLPGAVHNFPEPTMVSRRSPSTAVESPSTISEHPQHQHRSCISQPIPESLRFLENSLVIRTFPPVPGAVHLVPDRAMVLRRAQSEVVMPSPSVVAVARQVSESAIDQERAQIIMEARNEITSSLVRAEIVEDQSGQEDRKTKTQGILLRIGFAVLILALASVIAIVALVGSHKQDKRGNSIGTAPSLSAPAIQTTTDPPTPTPIVYLEDGRQAFTTTPQLYDAVDAYHQLLFSNPTRLNTSDIAITYGYPIGTWDVSRISDFSRVFDLDRDRVLDSNSLPMRRNLFNEDLSGWDLSNAVTMYGMFAGASKFVGIGLSNWNVSNVRDFSFLFKHAIVLNGNISKWDTSSATTMDGMFLEAQSFDGDLSRLDVSRVQSMAFMFRLARSYRGGDLTRWNVSTVRSMHRMFETATQFQGNISTWDTRNVREMHYMFASASFFNGDISSWSVGNVENMANMFLNAEAMSTVDLSRWDTGRVTEMSYMFAESTNFNGNVSTWDTSRVTTFEAMFQGCASFNSDISKWNTSSATSMLEMFHEASSFSSDVSLWDTRKVTSMSRMFVSASSFNSDLSQWNVSGLTDSEYMLHGASAYNHSLCSWMDQLRPDALVTEMFLYTDCTNTSDPVPLVGPFCSNCGST